LVRARKDEPRPISSRRAGLIPESSPSGNDVESTEARRNVTSPVALARNRPNGNDGAGDYQGGLTLGDADAGPGPAVSSLFAGTKLP